MDVEVKYLHDSFAVTCKVCGADANVEEWNDAGSRCPYCAGTVAVALDYPGFEED